MMSARAAIEHADSWTVAHGAKLDPFLWRDADEAEAQRKAFSEVCIYLYTCGGPSPALQALSDDLVRIATTDRYLDLVRRDWANLPLYAQPLLYALVRAAVVPRIRKLLCEEVDPIRLMGIERPPYRAMEIWHFYRAAGIEGFPLTLDEIEAVSCLRFPPCAIQAGAMSAYALTHAVFYATDFGSGRPGFRRAGDYRRFVPLLEVLILRFIGERHWDVALELAICQLLIAGAPSAATILLCDLVRSQLESNGVVTPPPGTEARSDRPMDVWRAHYHTMLVAGLFFRLLERSGAQQSAFGGDRGHALLLCEGLANLGQQDLYRGATILARVSQMPGAGDFAAGFDAALAYVRSRRSAGGGYGNLGDEEIVLRQRYGSEEAARLVAEAIARQNTACDEFLAVPWRA
jgi:hypothetical protein